VSVSLSNQCYEMAIHLISSEILTSSTDHLNHALLSLLASSDSSSEEEDLLYLFFLKKVYKCCVVQNKCFNFIPQAQIASDEEQLMKVVYKAYMEILSYPSSILTRVTFVLKGIHGFD
jgi:hypothetical protein